MAVQEGPTSIRVSWSPPTPLGDTTGYRIDYNDSDSSDSVDVSGGSTDNYTLTGLKMESTYTISIVATSEHLPSDAVDDQVTLSETLITQCSTVLCMHVQITTVEEIKSIITVPTYIVATSTNFA